MCKRDGYKYYNGYRSLNISELHGLSTVACTALGVEIGIVETASIKPQHNADVTRGYHPFPIPLTLQSMLIVSNEAYC